MNKRMQARAWKRTEKTRCYTRHFELVLFVHVNARHIVETRIEINRVETAIPELDRFQTSATFLHAPWKSGDQFLVPDDMTAVDFILLFSRNGKYPQYVRPVSKVDIQDNWPRPSNKMGTMLFKYEVNEYTEKHTPLDKLPWQARVIGNRWDDSENSSFWDWRSPRSMKAWLNKSKIIKTLKSRIQDIEDEQANLAMKKLQAA